MAGKRKPRKLPGKSPVQLSKEILADMRKEISFADYHFGGTVSGRITEYGKPTKPKQPPYAEERRDLVQAELAREVDSGNPNWTYVDALRKELEYWQGRCPQPVTHGILGHLMGWWEP